MTRLRKKLENLAIAIKTRNINDAHKYAKNTILILAAVKWFQSKNGLTADGIAGKKTLEAMGIYTSSSITSGGSNTGNTNDVNLLSRLIYGESRGEPYTGQVAVRCSCFK